MLQQGAPLLPVQLVDSLSMLAATSLQQRVADSLQGKFLEESGTLSDAPTGAPPLSKPLIATASAWRPWVAPSLPLRKRPFVEADLPSSEIASASEDSKVARHQRLQQRGSHARSHDLMGTASVSDSGCTVVSNDTLSCGVSDTHVSKERRKGNETPYMKWKPTDHRRVLCRALNALVDWGAFGASMRRFKTEGDSSRGYSRGLYEIILVDVFGAQFAKGGQWYKRCNAPVVLSQLLTLATDGRVVLTEEEARGSLTPDGCLAHLEGEGGGIMFRPGGTGAWTVNERMLAARGVRAEDLQRTLATLPLPPLPEPDPKTPASKTAAAAPIKSMQSTTPIMRPSKSLEEDVSAVARVGSSGSQPLGSKNSSPPALFPQQHDPMLEPTQSSSKLPVAQVGKVHSQQAVADAAAARMLSLSRVQTALLALQQQYVKEGGDGLFRSPNQPGLNLAIQAMMQTITLELTSASLPACNDEL